MVDPKETAAKTFTESVKRTQVLNYESLLTRTLRLFTLEHLQARYHYDQTLKNSTQKPAPDRKIQFTELAGLLPWAHCRQCVGGPIDDSLQWPQLNSGPML